MKLNLKRTFATFGVALTLLLTPSIAATSGVLNQNSKVLATNSKHFSESVLQIKFIESAGVTLKGNKFVSTNGTDLSALNDLLSDAKVNSKKKLFNDTDANINARRAEIKQRTGQSTPDLNSYFRIQLKNGQYAAEVSDQLKKLSFVESANAEPLPAPAPVSPSFVSQQIHLTNAPTGTGVTSGSSYPGATGTNVKLADLEYSWNSGHEDISKARASEARISNGSYPTDPFTDTNHGTAVTGLITGDINTYGINGISPSATLKLVNTYSSDQGWNVANAVYLAQANLSPGDVILIEQQTWGPVANTLVPVEWDPAIYDAIKTATAAGLIVIEPAANSGQNLDDPIYGTSFPQGKADSGAIIVGAGADCGTAPNRSRLSFSNYGNRVNVQGYGECVVTSGYGNLYSGTDENTWYTAYFNGTSSASAMVAGLAASLSSSYEQVNSRPANATLILNYLTNTGTAQDFSTDSGKIGPLPNLVAAQLKADVTPPSAPTNLTARLSAQNRVILNWTASIDKGILSHYRLYRNGVYLGNLGASNTTFTDGSVSRKTNYSYMLAAVDKSGNVSAFSNTVSIRTR